MPVLLRFCQTGALCDKGEQEFSSPVTSLVIRAAICACFLAAAQRAAIQRQQPDPFCLALDEIRGMFAFTCRLYEIFRLGPNSYNAAEYYPKGSSVSHSCKQIRLRRLR